MLPRPFRLRPPSHIVHFDMREANDPMRIDNKRGRDGKLVRVFPIAESEIILEHIFREILQLVANLEYDAKLPRNLIVEVGKDRECQIVLLCRNDPPSGFSGEIAIRVAPSSCIFGSAFCKARS